MRLTLSILAALMAVTAALPAAAQQGVTDSGDRAAAPTPSRDHSFTGEQRRSSASISISR